MKTVAGLDRFSCCCSANSQIRKTVPGPTEIGTEFGGVAPGLMCGHISIFGALRMHCMRIVCSLTMHVLDARTEKNDGRKCAIV